jgi:aromatic ring-opening dioxygenase catalytic subunit (LigB family)
MASEPKDDVPARTPVYFLGIGGPNFIENTKHPASAQLASIGHEITTQVKPKAVVVFSAHWQSSPNKIEINVAEQVDIIYDFYGFPAHYYEHE